MMAHTWKSIELKEGRVRNMGMQREIKGRESYENCKNIVKIF